MKIIIIISFAMFLSGCGLHPLSEIDIPVENKPIVYPTYFDNLESSIVYYQSRNEKQFIYLDKTTQKEVILPNSTISGNPQKIVYSKNDNFITFIDNNNFWAFSDPGRLVKYYLSTKQKYNSGSKLFTSFMLSPDGKTYLAYTNDSNAESNFIIMDANFNSVYKVYNYLSKQINSDSLKFIDNDPIECKWITSTEFIAEYFFGKQLKDSTWIFFTEVIKFDWNGTEIINYTFLNNSEITTSNLSNTFSFYFSNTETDTTIGLWETKLFVVNELTKDTIRVNHKGNIIDASFSANGNKLLLWVGITSGDKSQCYIYDLQTSNMYQICPELDDIDFPSFSISGNQIIFETFYNKNRAIFVVNVDNTNPTVLSNTKYSSMVPICVKK